MRQEEGPVVIRPVLPTPPAWTDPVIGPPAPEDIGKKTLVLDLDETLVHSSFKPVASPDYIIPVEIEGRVVDVYVLKRPHVDEFLEAVGERFEVVVFTASLGKYADPLLDLLDSKGVVRWRLFREACYPYEGSYVKDLQCMGRPPEALIIIDNSPHSYIFQPENALPIGTFIDDMQDEVRACGVSSRARTQAHAPMRARVSARAQPCMRPPAAACACFGCAGKGRFGRRRWAARHPALLPTHPPTRTQPTHLQELLDCLEVLKEIEHAKDARQGLATQLATRRAAALTQAVGRLSNGPR